MKEGDLGMKARVGFLLVALVLVFGLVVYGDGYDIVDGGKNNNCQYMIVDESEHKEKCVIDTDEQCESCEPVAPAAPTLFGVASFGTDHPVWDAAGFINALSIAQCGDTITLMDDITHSHLSHLFINGKSITLVTNGSTLDVYGSVFLSDGALLLDDSSNGEFNFSGGAWPNIQVLNGQLEVTNITITTGHAISAFHGSIINVMGDVTTKDVNSSAIHAQDNSIVYVGGNVMSAGTGVYAQTGAVVNVGGDITANSFGAIAINGGEVHVTNGALNVGGNIPGVTRGILASGMGSIVVVAGNVTATATGNVQDNSVGVLVSLGAEALVGGNVIVTGVNSIGVSTSGISSLVTVEGSVEADFFGVAAGDGAKIDILQNITSQRGVIAVGDSEVAVKGNVIATHIGAVAYDGGEITISGTMTAPLYVRIGPIGGGGIEKAQTDFTTPTTRPNYFTYNNAPTNPTSTVWVRGNPTATSLTATTPSMQHIGGGNTITLTGSDFGATNLRIAAFLNNAGSALYTQIATGTASQATATLNFPANTSTITRTYTIRVSLDGGTTWLPAPTATITVTPASGTPAQPPPSNGGESGSVSSPPSSGSGGAIWTPPTTNAQRPNIMQQPENSAVTQDDNLTLSIQASVTDGGTLSFQWFGNTTNNNRRGIAIPGATSREFTPPTDIAGTFYFYVVVTNTNNNVNGNRTATRTSNAVAVTVTAIPPEADDATPEDSILPSAPPQLPFIDITATDWFYPYVRAVWESQLFHGTSYNTFTSQGSMTRAMFVQVLANLEGVDLTVYQNGTPTFTDTSPAAWYFAAVEWAAGQGLVQGTGNGNFAPGRPITRQEMAVMLNNYVTSRNILLSQGEVHLFTDQENVSAWALDSVLAMQAARIIQGGPNGSFAPRDIATRAEAAALFARFLDIAK